LVFNRYTDGTSCAAIKNDLYKKLIRELLDVGGNFSI